MDIKNNVILFNLTTLYIMNNKLELIQKLIQTENVVILQKIKSLLEHEKEYSIPQVIWDETIDMRKKRLQGKGDWVDFKDIDKTLHQRYHV